MEANYKRKAGGLNKGKRFRAAAHFEPCGAAKSSSSPPYALARGGELQDFAAPQGSTWREFLCFSVSPRRYTDLENRVCKSLSRLRISCTAKMLEVRCVQALYKLEQHKDRISSFVGNVQTLDLVCEKS